MGLQEGVKCPWCDFLTGDWKRCHSPECPVYTEDGEGFKTEKVVQNFMVLLDALMESRGSITPEVAKLGDALGIDLSMRGASKVHPIDLMKTTEKSLWIDLGSGPVEAWVSEYSVEVGRGETRVEMELRVLNNFYRPNYGGNFGANE